MDVSPFVGHAGIHSSPMLLGRKECTLGGLNITYFTRYMRRQFKKILNWITLIIRRGGIQTYSYQLVAISYLLLLKPGRVVRFEIIATVARHQGPEHTKENKITNILIYVEYLFGISVRHFFVENESKTCASIFESTGIFWSSSAQKPKAPLLLGELSNHIY